MRIENRKEKIIFTEDEARAMVLVYGLMRDIQCNAEDDDALGTARDAANLLAEFIEDNFDDMDCVVCQPVADSVKEVAITIAIK